MSDISPELNQSVPDKDKVSSGKNDRSLQTRLKKVAGKVIMGTPLAGLILSSGSIDNPDVRVPTSENPAIIQTIDSDLEVTDRVTDTYAFTSTKEGFLLQKDKLSNLKDRASQIFEDRKNVNHERVVRFFLNGSSSGVGWIMDDGYVLTAAHVLGHEGLREIKLSDGKIVKIEAVSMDREKDIALVKYKSDENKFEGTKIGTYKEGEFITMMTLDNDNDEDRVLSQKAAESNNTRILTNNEMQKEAIPSTPQDLALAGMSGSAYLDEEGHLVGVLKESGVSSGGWPGNKIDKAPYNVLVPSDQIIIFFAKIQSK